MNDESRLLVAIVAGVSGETFNTILSGTRRRPLPICRYIVARELYKRGYSLPRAGAELGIDHATVLHACKQIEQRLSIEKKFQHEVEMIENELHTS